MESEQQKLCQICDHETPREGMKVCDSCLGLDRKVTDPLKEIDRAVDIDVKCTKCDSVIVPYKVGPHWRKKGECKTCFYKRKYGPDWHPGIRSFNAKRAKKKDKQMDAICQKPEPANSPPKPKKQWKFVAADHPPQSASVDATQSLMVTFEGPDDQAMFDTLTKIARKERRTTAAQILYFLDGCLTKG